MEMTAVPARPRWMMIVGSTILALLALTQQAHAQSDWPAVFIDKYSPGPTVSAAASNCSLCHTQVPTRNPYGMTIEPANDATIDERLTLAEPVNSDGDTDGSGNACSVPTSRRSTPTHCRVMQARHRRTALALKTYLLWPTRMAPIVARQA